MTWAALLLSLVLSSTAQAVTLDENHALDPNAHHGKLHALTHGENGEDPINVENLRTGCGAGEIAKSDGANGMTCQADSGDSTASYVTINPEAGLSSERVLGTQVIMKDLFSSRPAAGTRGRLFWSSDTKVLYRDDVSTWDAITNNSVAGFTEGSVLFADANGAIAADPTRLVWDTVAGRLVLSTTPEGPSADVFQTVQTFGINNSARTGLLFRGARGTPALPTPAQSGDVLSHILAEGWTGASWLPSVAIEFEVVGTPSLFSIPGDLVFSTATTGQATVTERMRLTHNGNLTMLPSGGTIVLPNDRNLRWFDAAGAGTIPAMTVSPLDRVVLAPAGAEIQLGRPTIAVGAGIPLTTSAAVIGCSGCPSTPTQAAWFKFFDSNGVASYVPIWR